MDSLWAWGYNGDGELGLGHTMNQSSPVLAGMGIGDWVEGLLGRGTQPVALKNDGTLWAWGDNFQGQLGLGDMDMRLSPIGSPILSDLHCYWTDVSAGGITPLAVMDDGTLWAWGRNWNGELGIGNTDSQPSPVKIGTSDYWASVYAGMAHSLAVNWDGTLWAWGANANGQLGIGNTTDQSGPDEGERLRMVEDRRWGNAHAGGESGRDPLGVGGQ